MRFILACITSFKQLSKKLTPYVHWLLIVLLYFSYGASFVFLKELVMIADPMLTVFWRLAISGVIFLVWFLIRDGRLKQFEWSDIFLLAQFCIIAIAGSFCLSTWAAQYISATRTCFYYNLAPFMTAFLAYVVYGTFLNTYQIVGGVIAFMAFIPYLYHLTHMYPSFGQFYALPLLPHVVMVGAVVSYAYGWIVLDKLKKKGHSDSFINGIGMLGVSIGLLAIIPFYEPLKIIPLESAFWVNLGFLIFTGNIIFYALYGYLLYYFQVTLLSFMAMMAPLFTALINKILYDVSISNYFFITFIFVSLGLYVFTRGESS